MSRSSESTKTGHLSDEERLFIEKAHGFLENPSLLIRIANKIGKPIERTLEMMPDKQKKMIHQAVDTALRKGLVAVCGTVTKPSASHGMLAKPFAETAIGARGMGLMHSAAAFGTGAAGGFFGFASLPIELPVTTAIMLRSIAATAQEFGMDLTKSEVQLECLYILSLGSPGTEGDDAVDSAYWGSRVAFSKLMQEAAQFLASRTFAQVAKEIEKNTAPILVRFIAQVASRFEVVVSEKVLAELVPAIGAIGGGLINAAFTDYFSEAARYHFGLRALEEKHGVKAIRAVYDTFKSETVAG